MLFALILFAFAAPSSAHLFSSCVSDSISQIPSSSDAFYYVRDDLQALPDEDRVTIAAYSGLVARTLPSLALVGKDEDRIWLNAMLESQNRTS